MRLRSLALMPRGTSGWGSGVLQFGQRATALFAKNGSGKTPIVHALAFCLGYPVTFRDDINEKCDHAILEVQHAGIPFSIRRFLGKEFRAQLVVDGVIDEYLSEADFGSAIFELLGMRVPALVSNARERTQPYLATVLPLYYVNQDVGYSDAYKPRASFISDQFVEMVRFVFGLAPRHSFHAQKDLLDAKASLERLHERIVEQQRRLADRAEQVEAQDTLEALDERTDRLKEKLAQLQSSMASSSSGRSMLQELVFEKDNEIRNAKRSGDLLRDRLRGIDTIRGEIDAELQTLTLNEEAKRVFESFNEICGNPDCGLFIGSSQSYAKNLLYLKDQLKDLASSEALAKNQLTQLEEALIRYQNERAAIAGQIGTDSRESGANEILAAIGEVTKELYNTTQRRVAFELFAKEKSTYYNLEIERGRVHDRIANLTRSGNTDHEFNKLRLDLRELVVKWLDVLETRNVRRDVEIDNDFRFTFGGEKIDAINGSTRIRVVLAIHAALFEQYLRDAQRPFRFLILDTPKQQEIQTNDLSDYLIALSDVAGNANAQVIFSTTEYQFPCKAQDAEWTPGFDGSAQPMYLGSVE